MLAYVALLRIEACAVAVLDVGLGEGLGEELADGLGEELGDGLVEGLGDGDPDWVSENESV